MAKKQFHSRAYHQYFEGFAERKHYDENGKVRIDRVYVGNYYRRNVSARQHKLLRVWYVVMYILALILFLFAGTRSTQLNAVVYVFIPVTLSLMVMIWMLVPLFFNLTAPREMIIRTYRDSSERLASTSLWAAILQGISAITTAVGMFLIPGQVGPDQFISIGGFLAAAAILLWLRKTELSLEYETLPPRSERPPLFSMIQLKSIY